MDGIKILIADGSPIFRKMFVQAADAAGASTVVHASTWEEAFGKIRCGHYDILVLDAEIAGVNAAELLPEIARELPDAVVLIAARPSPSNDALFADAAARGAADCMVKPIYDGYHENFEAVRGKMADIVAVLRARRGGAEKPPPRPARLQDMRRFRPEIALVAASTGGPAALDRILPSLSESFPVPILIVQHMMPLFTETMARELDRKSRLRVKIAKSGEPIAAGTAYVAPGGFHMRLNAGRRIAFDGSPPLNGVRPAADALFESVAEISPWAGILAVILTGMGRDGERGLASLKRRQSCLCLAQSEETCVIYGMPRAVVESGLADRVVDLGEIAREMENVCFPRADEKSRLGD